MKIRKKKKMNFTADTLFKKKSDYLNSRLQKETSKVNTILNSNNTTSTITIQTSKINQNQDPSVKDYKLNLNKLQDFYSKNDKNKIICVNLEIIK